MSFERQDTPGISDIDSLKNELISLVSSELKAEKIDSNSLYAKIKEKIGAQDIDDAMLNFAVNTAVGEIKKSKDAGKVLSKLEFQKQVNLVVDWTLIKIKGKNDAGFGNIGVAKQEDIDYSGGSDDIVLKDLKMK